MFCSERKLLVLGAIQGCGIGTAIVNGIILYFTLPKIEQIGNASLTLNFFGMALGCGLLCPLFGTVTLKNITKKRRSFNIKKRKDEHLLAKFVPNNLGGAVFVICFLTASILWGVPYFIALLLKPQFQFHRFLWLFIVAIYSGICASFAVYLGMLRSYFAKKTERCENHAIK